VNIDPPEAEWISLGSIMYMILSEIVRKGRGHLAMGGAIKFDVAHIAAKH